MRGDRFRSLIVVLVALVSACAGATPIQPASSTAGPTTLPTAPAAATPPASKATPARTVTAGPSVAVAPIVGEWVGTHECERVRAMLIAGGLDEFVGESIYGNGLLPGVETEAEFEALAEPCAGAVARAHSHVFTADGRFASRDFRGEQVDDGTYALEGDDVVIINGSRFGYRVDADELTLVPEPVDIATCTTKECRFVGAWVLMVAGPGTAWTRGTIPG